MSRQKWPVVWPRFPECLVFQKLRVPEEPAAPGPWGAPVVEVSWNVLDRWPSPSRASTVAGRRGEGPSVIRGARFFLKGLGLFQTIAKPPVSFHQDGKTQSPLLPTAPLAKHAQTGMHLATCTA
ncbi:gamma-glutamylaminecyclotransferase isoform X3 [Lepus europaeus]|uniref:gamma-glutamylaminecyclotransferase isoform X3 n=1 Tax=Lepus europaeus TaxID=9983 RepID=UPI002B47A405|nr:gamma-glutamylaminecyclotransferase isoform X3 [Lepus europaeus]